MIRIDPTASAVRRCCFSGTFTGTDTSNDWSQVQRVFPGPPTLLVGEERRHASVEDEPTWLAVSFHVTTKSGDRPERIVDCGPGRKLAWAHLDEDIELQRGEDVCDRARRVGAAGGAKPTAMGRVIASRVSKASRLSTGDPRSGSRY